MPIHEVSETTPETKRRRRSAEVDATTPPRHTRASALVRAYLAGKTADQAEPVSQATLAARFAAAGHVVSQPTISQIARGRLTKPPGKRTVAAFAEVLGIAADWWLTDANDSTDAATTNV